MLSRTRTATAATAAIAWAACAGAGHAWAAPTLTVLGTFNGTDGTQPQGNLLLDGQGNLVGATGGGGPNVASGVDGGVVFRLPTTGGTPTVLASFDGTTGPNPSGGLTRVGNALYGTTANNAGPGPGTVYSVPLNGGPVTTLAQLGGAAGIFPTGTLATDGANLYGTTMNGAANAIGSVFSVPVAGGAATPLATINGGNGSQPQGSLLLRGGALYGTTTVGGADNDGTVFRLPLAGGGGLQTLASFNASSGSVPKGGLAADAAGDLFGSTQNGGAGGAGTVFELPANGGPLITLASFPAGPLAFPQNDVLVDAAGDVFGTSIGNGGSDGGVWEVPAGGGTPVTVADFATVADLTGGPLGTGLIADPATGTLYGTTGRNGTDFGAVYAVANSGFQTAVPEPTSAALLAAGTIGLVGRRRRRQAARA